MDCVILAGGLGTRLKDVVPDRPKPMALINGKPFLDYQMRYWKRQGVTRFILSVGYRWETIHDHFGASFEGCPVEYAIETTPLGTGGGLLLAVRKARRLEPVLVLNGDTYYEAKLTSFLDFHVSRQADVSVALVPTSGDGRYSGVLLGQEGEIVDFRARDSQRQAKTVNGGVYLFQCDLQAEFPTDTKLSLEDEIFPTLLERRRRLFGWVCSARFIDIGVPADYLAAGSTLK